MADSENVSKSNFSDSSFNCFLINAQSITKKFNFFHFEVMVQHNYPRVVFITETWLTDEHPNSLFLCNDSYSIYRKDRALIKGGGVAILVRNDIDSFLIDSPLLKELEVIACQAKCYDTDVIFAMFL